MGRTSSQHLLSVIDSIALLVCPYDSFYIETEASRETCSTFRMTEEEPQEAAEEPKPKPKRKAPKKRSAKAAAAAAAAEEPPTPPPPPERLPSDHGLHVTEVLINRAPVLTLWVAEVAKRQGCAPTRQGLRFQGRNQHRVHEAHYVSVVLSPCAQLPFCMTTLQSTLVAHELSRCDRTASAQRDTNSGFRLPLYP